MIKSDFNWKKVGMALGIGAFFVSAYFTCDLLIAEAATGREKFVHFIWGLVCQGFLTFFCSLMFVFKGGKRIVYGALFLVALLLSLQGTIAQRAMNRQVKLNSEIANDSEYNDLKAGQKRLKDKIDKFDDKILEFIDDRMIKNGQVPTEGKRKEAKSELDEIERRIANYTHESGSEANAPFVAWARFVSPDGSPEEIARSAERTHMIVTIGYAILLDVGGPVAFGAMMSPQIGVMVAATRRRREEEEPAVIFNHPLSNQPSPRPSHYAEKRSGIGFLAPLVKDEESVKTINSSNHEFDGLKKLPEDVQVESLPRGEKTIKSNHKSLPGQTMKKTSVYSKELLPDYIKVLFDPPKKNGSLNGWKQNGIRLNYTQKVAEKCHEECKRLGLTQLKRIYGKHLTYPKMTKDDMLKAVNGIG